MPARTEPVPASRDPLVWCWALTIGFLALVLHRLAIPTKPYFDEVHYLPAARALLTLGAPLNLEHPLLGKELIAAGIALLGDRPFGWRLPAALAGATALFAGMRAVWWASQSAAATLLAGALFASNFMLFAIARIAMLDGFMLAFALLAAWWFARALRRPEHGRRDLALTGVALGLAVAAKWTAAPLLPLPALAFAAARWAALPPGRRVVLLSEHGEPPVREVTVIEAWLWLGAVPLAVYFATYLPMLFLHQGALRPGELVDFQLRMATLQSSVVQPHPYQSVWWQWVLNLRPIWFLYEVADGAQRGVLFIGNPATMLLGLPALLFCAARGLRRDWAMLGAALLYAASLGLWLVAPKPVQFYYHYLLPGTFLSAALALALGRWWERGRRWPAMLSLAAALGLFGFFYPILSAAALPDDQAFLTWTWLDSWR